MITISYVDETHRRAKVVLEYKLDKEIFDKFLAICDSRNARFYPEANSQTCTIDSVPELMESLTESGFECVIEDELLQYLKEIAERTKRDLKNADIRLRNLERRMMKRTGCSLYPYQRVGVQWLSPRRRAVLADEMGLGKTIQSLFALPRNPAVVVICPNMAKNVWLNECKKWRPDIKPYVISGRGNFFWPRAGEMYIFNYDILPGSAPTDPPKGVIVIGDELSYCKNPKAKRTKFFRNMRDAALANHGKVWGLTGTPLLNRPGELWVVLNAADLSEETYGSWRNFIHIFDGHPSRFGYEWGTPKPEAAPMLKRTVLRRQRVDVLPDLPTKTYTNVPVDINDPEVNELLADIMKQLDYDGIKLDEATLDELKGEKVIFENMSRLRALLAKAKIPFMMEYVEEYEENDEPLIVFSAHRAPIDYLGKRKGWTTITGDTTQQEREDIVKDFQAGKYKGLAITIQSGGMALTLTHAAHALFIDLMWTPALNWQAEDRLCRIGQDRGVLITSLVCNHPLEMRVHELLTKKAGIIKIAIDEARVKGDEITIQRNDDIILDKVTTVSEKKKAIEVNAGSTTTALARLGSILAKNDQVKHVAVATIKHHPSNPMETWASDAILQLAGDDPDRAQVKNNVGFSKIDNNFGHSLAKHIKSGGLTDKEWREAIRLAKKYSRQVGQAPAA